jgi:dihydrofolate reductase
VLTRQPLRFSTVACGLKPRMDTRARGGIGKWRGKNGKGLRSFGSLSGLLGTNAFRTDAAVHLALDKSHPWNDGSEDEAVKRWILDSVWAAGAHLMGRVTYEEIAGFWPTPTSEYARPINEIPKVVFSKTLQHADWPESRIARGDLAEEIANLKREPGNDLIAYGGASFDQALSRLGLVDEYRLMIQPAALGAGLPLFKDLPAPLHLELVGATTYATGLAIHVYRPRFL